MIQLRDGSSVIYIQHLMIRMRLRAPHRGPNPVKRRILHRITSSGLVFQHTFGEKWHSPKRPPNREAGEGHDQITHQKS